VPVDYRKDPEAWADALLDQHRTAPRRDPERDREAADRALRDLSPVARWMLTRGGQAPDLETIERIQRNSKRHAVFQKWEAIFTILGVVLLCLFGLAWSSSW
jgi:fatty-acid desaturase